MDRKNPSAPLHAQINTPDGPYAPLCDPDRTQLPPGPLDAERAAARQVLAETAPLNVYSRDDLLAAAFALYASLRALAAALDAENGPGPA